MLCLRKILGAKNFMDKKGGVSILFVEKFCLSAEKNCKKTLYFVLNFGYQGLLSKIVLSHSAEKRRRGTL